MKKYSVKIMILSCLIIAFQACRKERFCLRANNDIVTETVYLEDFHSIVVSGDMKVYIEEGPIQSVEIEASSNVVDRLKRNVKNGVWEIALRKCVKNNKSTVVRITVPVLNGVEVNGSGSVDCNSLFVTERLKLEVSGSGDINMNVQADDITSKISGSGAIALHGATKKLSLDISGSGKQTSFGLSVDQANVKISGSGKAELYVNQQLDVNISGSGRVEYMGTSNVNTSISGSGKVLKK